MSTIAISLPDEVLEAIEEERKAIGESRSAFFRRAVEAFLRQQRDRKLDELYIRGYSDSPETPDEVEGALNAGLVSFAQEPWNGGDDE